MYKSVLVVEDEPEMRMLIQLMLRGTEYRVIAEAEDGAEAVALYRRLRPDVVLLDLMLPCVDGFDALDRIRGFDPKAKVIVCTVLRNYDTAKRVQAAGASAFIRKPFGRTELERALQVVN